MWPFRSAFEAALSRRAKTMHVRAHERSNEEEGATASLDWCLEETTHPRELGTPCALVLGQAESDGARRVRFQCGHNRMVYTISGVDYDMVPPPPTVAVDLLRALVRASRCGAGRSGSLPVDFSDCRRVFTVAMCSGPEDTWVDVTGFAGSPSTAVHRTA